MALVAGNTEVLSLLFLCGIGTFSNWLNKIWRIQTHKKPVTSNRDHKLKQNKHIGSEQFANMSGVDFFLCC